MQARTLLALVINRPRRVTDSELVEVCWPSSPPPTALNSVRNTVARLRHTVGLDTIVRGGDGYLLSANVQVDLDEFAILAATAAALREANDVPAARASIASALALVRGDPFVDVADEQWAMSAAVYWCERVAAAEDLYIELAEVAADVAAMPRLRALARVRPEREQRWLALARLMNRSGRRVDALRTLNDARRALAQFGLDPSWELTALERTALSAFHDPATDHPADLRKSSDSIIGRDALLEHINTILADVAALTLTGVGGVGKTRLAVEVSYRTRLANGAAIVDLTHASDDVDVIREIAAAADISLESSIPADELERVADVLGSSPTLVVIDNADLHLRQVRDAVDALSGRLGDSRVLITSRWIVGFASEVVITVPPLELPPDDVALADVRESPAVELFFTRANTLEPSDLICQVVAEIVRAVGGNALAIQLCASLTRTLPVEEVRAGLVHSQQVLDLTSDTARAGMTLRSIFDNVIDRLAPHDKIVFARLGAFSSAFTLRSAQAVVVRPDVAASPLVATISRLVQASLVDVCAGEPTTYRLGQLQASLARELLDKGGRAAQFSGIVDAYYVNLAVTLAPSLRGPKQRETIAFINSEIGNIRHILDRSVRPLSPHQALTLAGSLGEYWFLTTQWAEGTRHIDAALARSAAERSVARATALSFRHRAGGSWSSVLHSERQMREAIAIAQELGREDIVNEVVAFAGLAQMSRGEVADGWSVVNRVARSQDSTPWAAAQARMLLGMASAFVGDLDRARDYCLTAVNAMLALGDELNAAIALKNLGMMLQRHGDGARPYLEQAIQMAGGLMPGVEAQARCALAEIDALEGVVDEDELAVLRSQLRKLGDLSGLTRANRVLAGALMTRGELDAALHTLQDSVMHLADHEEQALGLVLLDIAEIKRRQHCDSDANVLLDAATSLASGTGYGWGAKDRARITLPPVPRMSENDEELSVIQRAIYIAFT